MTKKIIIGLGVLMVSAVAAGSSAFAIGAGASARAHMMTPVKSLAKTVALRPWGIRRSLRARGYRNIVFIDRVLPVYKVRACRNGKRFKLRLNRWGDINRRVRIGYCGGPYGGPYGGPGMRGLSLPEIRDILRDRGYHRIHFTDRRLPGYGARACRNGRRFALRLNRWGRIMDRSRRGWCGYGSRHGARVLYRGPGISIVLGRGRY